MKIGYYYTVYLFEKENVQMKKNIDEKIHYNAVDHDTTMHNQYLNILGYMLIKVLPPPYLTWSKPLWGQGLQ